MSSIVFADALRPSPVRILRLPMRPYSLGHELILLQQRNPLLFLTPDEFGKLTIEQAAAVAFLCGMPLRGPVVL